MTDHITEAIANLSVEAQDISHGVYVDLESLVENYGAGVISRSDAEEQLAELRDDLEEAKTVKPKTNQPHL